jgi:hypothetical protein
VPTIRCYHGNLADSGYRPARHLPVSKETLTASLRAVIMFYARVKTLAWVDRIAASDHDQDPKLGWAFNLGAPVKRAGKVSSRQHRKARHRTTVARFNSTLMVTDRFLRGVKLKKESSIYPPGRLLSRGTPIKGAHPCTLISASRMTGIDRPAVIFLKHQAIETPSGMWSYKRSCRASPSSATIVCRLQV